MTAVALRAPLGALFVLLVLQAACGDGLEDSDPDGGGSASLGIIGQACDSLRPCQPGLHCYSGDQKLLGGLCTMSCTVSGTADPCTAKHPNAVCLAAGVCGATCAGGKACPSGSVCNESVEVCVNTANSCASAGDGICGEPSPCTPGTDTADCG